MNETYVKLYRKLKENPISSNLELLWFFSYLLLEANFKDWSFYVWLEKITIKPGEILTSQRKLAEKFWLSLSKINRMIKILENEWIVKHKKNTKFTLLELKNWDKYNWSETQMKQVWNTNETRKETIKEEKRIIKNNKEINYNNNLEIEISGESGKNEIKNFSIYENKEEEELEKKAEVSEKKEIKSSAVPAKNCEKLVKKDITESIDNLIIELKSLCNELWIAYDKTHERNFWKHILTAKDFGEFSKNLGQSRIEFSKNILKASLQVNFWKICSGPKLIYQNYAEVYNKFLILKNNWKIWQVRQQSSIITI